MIIVNEPHNIVKLVNIVKYCKTYSWKTDIVHVRNFGLQGSRPFGVGFTMCIHGLALINYHLKVCGSAISTFCVGYVPKISHCVW